MPSDTPPPPQTSQSPTMSQSTEQRSSSVPPASSLSTEKNENSSKNAPQQFCLRWNNYQTNLTSVFDQLLQSESFVDCTLACDGHSIKAHKMVLSACSPYFQALFMDNPCQHPIIIMRDVKWIEMKAIVEFMYKGEINVSQDQIGPLLKLAEMLKIRGLADVNGENADTENATSTPTANLVDNENNANNNNNDNVTADNNNDNCSKSSNSSGSGKNSAKKTRTSRERDLSKESANRDFEREINREILSREATREFAAEWQMAGLDTIHASTPRNRKRRWPSGERSSQGSPSDGTPDNMEVPSPIPPTPTSMPHPPSTPTPIPPFPIAPQLDTMALNSLALNHPEDMEIKPGIAEMIREEERVSFFFIIH